MKTIAHRSAEMHERSDGGFTLTEMTLGITIILVITAVFTRAVAGDQPGVWKGMAVAAAASMVVLAATLAVNYLRIRQRSADELLAAVSDAPEDD